MDKEVARAAFVSPGGAPPSEDTDRRNISHLLRVPEPSSRAVRFQDEPHEFRRSGRRKSISMPTELNLLLEFAEFSCQPKPGGEKDYFDEVEEQQIHRSDHRQPSAAPAVRRGLRFPSESEDDGNEAELDDIESMSTTGDELSEIDSPSTGDPPPPYPGAAKNGRQLRRTTRFLDPGKRKEIEEDALADEYTKRPLATRRKSGGLPPLKNLNSNQTGFEDDEDENGTGQPAPDPADGKFKALLRGKLNYISQKVPTAKFRMRKRSPDDFKIQIFVTILFLMIVLLIGSIYVIHQEKELQKAYFNRIRFSSKDRKFRLSNLKGREVLAGVLGTSLTARDKAWPCLKIHQRDGESCLEWMDKARLYFRLMPSPGSKDSPSSLNPSLDSTASPTGQDTGSETSQPSQQQCYGTQWESLSPSFIPMDCFYVNEKRGFHFYGGGEQEVNHWPLNRTIVPLTPFVTGNKIDGRGGYVGQQKFQWGRFLKRQFFGAPGVSIEIWKDVPLHVSINSEDYPGMMCFAAKHNNFAYPEKYGQHLVLNYTICSGANVQQVTATSLFASTRENLEDLRHEDVLFARRLIKTPIWRVMPSIFSNTSSGASSEGSGNSNIMNFNDLAVNRNSSIFEKQLLDHADRIKAESLSEDNILLIDESWEKHVGDYEIDLDRFPTIEQTLNYTQRRGFQIAFTVQPYFSTESENYIDGLNKDLWVKEKRAAAMNSDAPANNESGGSYHGSIGSPRKVPALVQFKNSFTSVLLDVTRSKARSWFEDKIRSFVRKYSMNALFIELGSTLDLPQYYEFHHSLQNPDDYKNLFIQSIRKGVSFMNTIGVSSAVKSPKLPTFVSLSPVESSWTGLQSIIPNLLTMGITGFSFILTGPIGGSYKRVSQLPRNDPGSSMSVFEANKPDRNLYIRWLELTYFLPIVQYTYLPSDYDSNVLEIARYHKQLRETKVQSFIKKAIDESLTQGTALIQPLWMIDPQDINCLVVSDQFTIGGQIMVAPILKANSTERDIYLPKGKWKDELYGTTTKGEKWLHRYPVQEHQIAFFTKMYDGFS